MGTLAFFGWVLQGQEANERIYFAPPTGTTLWGPRDLYVTANTQPSLLKTEQNLPLRFKLDGLNVEVELDPNKQVQVLEGPKGTWRVRDVKDGVFLRLGPPEPDQLRHRFLIGPATVSAPNWPQYRFGEFGEAVIELSENASKDRFLVDRETGGDLNALAVQLGRSHMTVNLAQREVVLAEGSLTASLLARRENGSTSHEVLFTGTAHTFTFVQLVAKQGFGMRFSQSNDQTVRLNIPLKGDLPLPGIEVINCALDLRFEKSSTGAVSSVSEAELVPVQGKDMVLRFHGACNSRNQAEEWVSSTHLPLAFRTGWKTDQTWSSPMLRPGVPIIGLRRHNGLLQSGTYLPMHGAIPGSQFRFGSHASCSIVCTTLASEADKKLPSLEWRGDRAKLSWGQTRPWLQLLGAEFRYARPGDAYVGAEPWTFKAAADKLTGGTPAIPIATWRQGLTEKVARGNDEIDGSFADLVLQGMSGSHETGLQDRTDALANTPPKILHVMPANASREERHTLVLANHVKQLTLAAPQSSVPVIAGAAPVPVPAAIALKVNTPPGDTGFDYTVCWPGAKLPTRMSTFTVDDFAEKLKLQIDVSVPIGVSDVRNDLNRPNTLPLAILKIGRQRGIEQILRELAPFKPGRVDAVDVEAAIVNVMASIKETDNHVMSPDWVGLVAFTMPLDFSNFKALQNTIPLGGANSPRMDFLALGPKPLATGVAPARDATLSAAVRWKSPYADQALKPGYYSDKSEVSFWPLKLDMRFRQSRMTVFRSEMQVEFRSFFGMGNPRQGATVDNRQILLLGSAKRVDPTNPDSPVEFRFAAGARDPIQVYPFGNAVAGDEESFLEGVWFNRLELADVPDGKGGRAIEVRVDGDIALRKPKAGFSIAGEFFSKIGGRRISFRNLGIRLEGISQLLPRMMEITYPSLAFNLDLPHVELFGNALRMKLHQIALNWSGGFEFPGFLDLGLQSPQWDPRLPNVFFNGRIDFGSLPAFFARHLSGFSLELGLGLNFDPARAAIGKGRQIALRGFGFDGLNLDLLQFLQVSINSIALGPMSSQAGQAIGAKITIEGATVKLLKFTIFESASGGFFSLKDGGGDGFWAYFPERPKKSFLFFFDWGFVAKNVDFDPAVAKLLLLPPLPNETIADGDAAQAKGKKMAKMWEDNKIRPATDTAGRGWTFAAGMTVLDGALKGRALVQDSGFAGLTLWGPKLKEWFGYDFSFCGIYRKNITPGEDYFFISTTLPAVTMGTVHFTGGVVALEIYTSGDFMLDFGFPWNKQGGGREWRRTIGAIVTPGQASAGFYIRKREATLPTGETMLSLSAGFAVQWGLGAAFNGGIFRAWVRIGLYAILEGSVDLRIGNTKLLALVVAGAGGVLVEGEGSINWWVISVRVYVCASAEVRLQLSWYDPEHPKPLSPPGQTRLQLRAELYISASAEACVGGGWFKVCRSITVGLTIPAKYELTF